MFKGFRLVCILFYLLLTSVPVSSNPLILENTNGNPSLTGHLSWFVGSSQLGLEEIVKHYQAGHFLTSSNNEIAAGFHPEDAVWVHFSVTRQAGTTKDWWLTTPIDAYDFIDAYLEKAGGLYTVYQGGRVMPFAKRQIFWRGQAFHLNLERTGETQIYLRVKSWSTISLPLQLWQEQDFEHFRILDELGFGVFFGIMSIVLFLSTYRAVVHGFKVDAYYAVYIFCFVLSNMILLGFFQQMGLSDDFSLRYFLLCFAGAFLAVALLWCLVWFITWPVSIVKLLINIVRFISVLYVLIITGVWIFMPSILALWVSLGMLVLLVIEFLMLVWATWNDFANARIFALAYLPFVVSAMLLFFVMLGFWQVQDTWLLRKIIFISAIFHAVSMTVVILYREGLQRKQNEKNLHIAATTFETPHEAIVITDTEGKIVQVNHFFEHVTGYEQSEVLGESITIFDAQQQPPDFYQHITRTLSTRGAWSGDCEVKCKNGGYYLIQINITAIKDASDSILHFVAAFKDISELKKIEALLQNLAFYDSLTQLPNRQLLTPRIALALSNATQNQQFGALLFLNIDNFKLLNDTQGSYAGDQLLVQISLRLQACLTSTETLARIGGDEFVLLVENLGSAVSAATHSASVLAETIRVAISQPYSGEHQEQHLYASIGVVLFCDDSELGEDLLKYAGIAMSAAKNAGGNQVHFFKSSLLQHARLRAELEENLHHALVKKQLQLFYQVQVDQHRRPWGAEALLRWRMSNGEWCSPAEFIPIAEQSDLILKLGAWVLEAACQQLAQWSQYEHTRDLVLAVNISAKQFKQDDFMAQVKAVIQQYGIAPYRLKFELTESLALENLDEVITKMLEVKQALGIKLSLDDFGTGFSSLSYLKRLPVDQIKIDQSFVRNITTDASDAVMVKSIIDMAHNFGYEVIAEGVETEDQLNFLQQHGCILYQGYLFSKPLPIEAFEQLIQIGKEKNK